MKATSIMTIWARTYPALISPRTCGYSQEYRTKLIEAISDFSDDIMEKLKAKPSGGEIKAQLESDDYRQNDSGFCGTSYKTKVFRSCLMRSLTTALPPILSGYNGQESRQREEVERHTDDEYFSALAFKIATDPFAENSVFPVYWACKHRFVFTTDKGAVDLEDQYANHRKISKLFIPGYCSCSRA